MPLEPMRTIVTENTHALAAAGILQVSRAAGSYGLLVAWRTAKHLMPHPTSSWWPTPHLLDIDWDGNKVITDVSASSPALIGFGGGRSGATRWACVLRTRDMK